MFIGVPLFTNPNLNKRILVFEYIFCAVQVNAVSAVKVVCWIEEMVYETIR